MGIADKLGFSPADAARARDIEADAMLDVFRDAERETWAAFAAAPSIETRKEHFLALMTLLREVERAGRAAAGATVSAHTPAPWEATSDDGAEVGLVEALSVDRKHVNREICHVLDGGDAETSANLRLIAAAPDLLAACEEALLSLLPADPTDRVGRSDTIVSLRAAIEKARGK
jgi:hypothetical protein